MLHLSAAVPSDVAEPMALDASKVSVGDSVTVVDFGASVEGDTYTAGTRRQATTQVVATDATTFELPGASSTQGGSCDGTVIGGCSVSGTASDGAWTIILLPLLALVRRRRS